MTLDALIGPSLQCRLAVTCLVLAATLVAASLPGLVQAQGPNGQAHSTASTEQGVRWRDLKPAQQSALKPLEQQWGGIDAPRKQKWLEVARRLPTLTPAERERIQARMAEWTRLTPQERGNARLRFQEAKQLPPQDRQARWNAYQALTPEQRQQFAARAVSPPVPADALRKSGPGARGEAPQAKSNIVPNPTFAAPARAIGPTVVQARPGATTTLITKRPAPPSHQQAGLPKIAATPGFVNKATLLPQRGPQGAATRSGAAPAAPAPPARQ